MNDFINKRPQELCLMCGKCCRVSTTSTPYSELLELFKNGDKGAIDFLSIFEPYDSAEDAKKVCSKTVENILKLTDKPLEDVTFYKCKYILTDNTCGIYEKRPELCKRFPSSPWAVVPPGCGYEGWLFKEREKIKQNIRKHKEALIEFEAELNRENSQEYKEKLKMAIDKIKNIIKFYEKYGSDNW
ncbi:MAG: YkgJ family cysteine cluster protein [Candidatus Gastranaerophilales bacterium]|nr:YkgJ family cysteine cluster protein [Candidatus Gastranaerophilales bacterium]